MGIILKGTTKHGKTELQAQCPKCGVSFNCLEGMLEEPAYADNYELATKIIKNCPVCSERFKGEGFYSGYKEEE